MTATPHKAAVQWCAVLLLGCATQAQPTEADVHAGFSRIQGHEADLAQANRSRAGSPAAGECGARCEAGGQARDAAEGICKIADALQDADAFQRCEAARMRAAHGSVSECDCAD